MQAYQKAYKRNFARIKYEKVTKEEFDEWSKEARRIRDNAIENNGTLDIFMIELKEIERY